MSLSSCAWVSVSCVAVSNCKTFKESIAWLCCTGGECIIHHCCHLFVCKMVDLSLPSAACSLASHVRKGSWVLQNECLLAGRCSNFPVLESEYIICCQTDISKLCQNLLANFLRYLTLTCKQSDSFDCYEKENYVLPSLCLDNCFSPWRHFDGANQMLSFCTARDGTLGRNQGMNREWLSNSTWTAKTCHTSLFNCIANEQMGCG